MTTSWFVYSQTRPGFFIKILLFWSAEIHPVQSSIFRHSSHHPLDWYEHCHLACRIHEESSKACSHVGWQHFSFSPQNWCTFAFGTYCPLLISKLLSHVSSLKGNSPDCILENVILQKNISLYTLVIYAAWIYALQNSNKSEACTH